MTRAAILSLATAIMIAISFSAFAGANVDEGLYDPAPPEGSAFIRFVHARQGKTGSEPASAGGKTFDYLEFKEVSSYFVIPQGRTKVAINQATQEIEVMPGNFYTLILTPDNQLKTHHDETSDNRAKAQVTLYNYGAQKNVSLKTSDGSIPVIENVARGESGRRDINPVNVSFAIFENDRKIAELESISLERSQSYSAFLFPDGDAIWKRAATNTTR